MSHQQIMVENTPRPLISFIIPYYNVPSEMLTACVDSILALSLQPQEREVIVVDDGADIPAENILNVNIESLHVVHQENQGPGAARNTGLALAHGAYIQFVDSDDYLIPSQYQYVIAQIRAQKPDLLLLGWTKHETFKCGEICVTATDGVSYVLNNNVQGAPWHYVFRLEILGNLRFPVGIYHEDEAFTPRLFLRAKTMLLTNITAYYYRTRRSSTMTRQSRAHFERRLDNLLTVIKGLNADEHREKGKVRLALKRRVSQLTMDFIYQVIALLHSRKDLLLYVKLLEKSGLYPLSKQGYTRKYQVFSKLANMRIGLELLFFFISRLKRRSRLGC